MVENLPETMDGNHRKTVRVFFHSGNPSAAFAQFFRLKTAVGTGVEVFSAAKVALLGRKSRAADSQKSCSRNASVGLLRVKSATLAMQNM